MLMFGFDDDDDGSTVPLCFSLVYIRTSHTKSVGAERRMDVYERMDDGFNEARTTVCCTDAGTLI